jgi:hypothetical protein
MKILVIGDSWGCGEWFHLKRTFHNKIPNPLWQPWPDPHNDKLFATNRVKPSTSLSHYFNELGNFSRTIAHGGDSNTNQLMLLEDYLAYNSDWDHIVWFQTEPVRDWITGYLIDNIKELDLNFDEWFIEIYDRAQKIYDEHHIPFTFIGGLCPAHPSIENYTFAKYLIKDWYKDFGYIPTNTPRPYNSSFDNLDIFLKEYEDKLDNEKVVKYLEDGENFWNQMRNNKKYLIQDHPSALANQELANYLVKLWQDS